MNDKSLLDLAIECLSVGLLLAGAAPALIAGAILAPTLILSMAGWVGIPLTALLVLFLIAPPSRHRRSRVAARATVSTPSQPASAAAAEVAVVR